MGHPIVSLDLGSGSVRAVAFTPGKNGPSIRKFAVAPLEPGVIVDGEVQQPEALTQALKQLWAREKLGTKQVHLSFGNNQIITRVIDTDWLPEEDFKQSLEYVAADHLPGDIEDVILDYHVIDEFEAPGEKKKDPPKPMRRIVLIAAATDMVTQFVDVVTAAGLLPLRANLVPFALIRAAHPTNSDRSEAEALVDIGADITSIVLHRDGQPLWVRTLPGEGGNKITNALMDRFGWDRDDAEATKIELGINTSLIAPATPIDSVFGVDTPAAPAPAIAEHPAYAVINQSVSTLIAEVRTSVEYFLSSHAATSGLTRVVLTGGGSLLKGLAQRLASELRVNVEYGTPLQDVSLTKAVAKNPLPLTEQQWAVAVGTALSAGAHR